MKDYPWGKGTPRWVRDATADDSDKSFTVPAGKVWKLISAEGELTTTATVGNRILNMSISNGAALVYSGKSTAIIAESKVGGMLFGPSVAPSTGARPSFAAGTTNRDIEMDTQIPEFLLTAGYVIRVWDTAAIAAAADGLIVVLHYVEYDA